MNQDIAQTLFVACENSIASLTELEMAIYHVPDDEERAKLLRAVSRSIIVVLSEIRAPVVLQHPEIEPPPELGEPDKAPSDDSQDILTKLTAAQLVSIDEVLISECATSWRKVARVVAEAMDALDTSLPDIPDWFYAERVAMLVTSGKLTSQGNLAFMRFSEVRLANTQATKV
jgi:hypothetical protein